MRYAKACATALKHACSTCVCMKLLYKIISSDFRLQNRITNMAHIQVITFFMFVLIFSSISFVNSASGYYAFARVESCSGCSLNRLPEVKQFIFEDLPQYDNMEFKHIQGAIPELVLFNEHEEEVERLLLSRLTREECNDLLLSKGFTKKFKDNKDEM